MKNNIFIINQGLYIKELEEREKLRQVKLRPISQRQSYPKTNKSNQN